MHITKGDRLCFRDEDGKYVHCHLDSMCGHLYLVVLDNGCIWPLREDELLAPF